MESKNLALLQLAQGLEKRRASDELFYTKEVARYGDTYRCIHASITSGETMVSPERSNATLSDDSYSAERSKTTTKGMAIAQIVHLNLWRTDGTWRFIAPEFRFYGNGLRTPEVNKAMAVIMGDNSVMICAMVPSNTAKYRTITRCFIPFHTSRATL